MKPISGCLVAIIVFVLLGGCLMPLGFFVGTLTSTGSTAIQTTGRILCPRGSTPTTYTYATTTRDENGNTQPSTGYALRCVDATGAIVKEDPIVYGFLWIGMFTAAGLIITLLLTLLFSAPAGAWIGGRLGRSRVETPSSPSDEV